MNIMEYWNSPVTFGDLTSLLILIFILACIKMLIGGKNEKK